jgi:uncharacterized membrane protein
LHSFDQEIAVRQLGRSAQQQRGAIVVFAAIGMSVVVIMLSLADIGFLYYYKREYQKAADLAAMAGARRLVSKSPGVRSCDDNARPAAIDNAARNLGGKNYALQVECGRWNPRASTLDGRLDTSVDIDELDAVRAIVSGTPPRFLAFSPSPTISARAIALADQPLAQLTIRSGVASINSEQSALLDAIVGGFLGGSISLPVAAWNGLLNTDINLLNYLDALALDLGIDAGNYDQVLGAEVTMGQLFDVAADVLNRGGGAGEVSAAVSGLNQLLGVNLPGFSSPAQLGDLLGVQAGTPASALDLGLNVLDLVQGGAQLASGGSVATVNLPVVGVPGFAAVGVKLQAIEPPMLSSVGNPALAQANPNGPDRIYVRTAQVRALIDIDLGGVTGLASSLTAAVSPLLSPIINFLNSAGFGGLNLLEAVGDLLQDVFALLLTACNNNCQSRNAVYAEALAQPLQISLDAAAANARVTGYDCSSGKSLDVAAETSVAHLRIGRMTESDVFSSVGTPTVDPVSVIEIGYRRVRPQSCFVILGIGSCSNEQWEQPDGTWLTNGQVTARRYVISGLGVKVDAPVGSATYPNLQYTNPDLPEVGQPPEFQDISTSNVVGSLATTLQNVTIEPYASAPNGLLGNLLNGTIGFLSQVIANLQDVIRGVLAALLDPLLDTLLPLLGINLATAEVGANLSCDGGGATLVN